MAFVLAFLAGIFAELLSTEAVRFLDSACGTVDDDAISIAGAVFVEGHAVVVLVEEVIFEVDIGLTGSGNDI